MMPTVWLFIGMAIASGLAVFLRGVVRNEAPAYTGRQIAIVGVTFGLLFAAALQVIAYYVVWSWGAAAVLFVWGLIATGYLFFEPAPNDHYRNAQQVALAAAGCYLVLTLVAVAARIQL
jgi:hypothetical protein